MYCIVRKQLCIGEIGLSLPCGDTKLEDIDQYNMTWTIYDIRGTRAKTISLSTFELLEAIEVNKKILYIIELLLILMMKKREIINLEIHIFLIFVL